MSEIKSNPIEIPINSVDRLVEELASRLATQRMASEPKARKPRKKSVPSVSLEEAMEKKKKVKEFDIDSYIKRFSGLIAYKDAMIEAKNLGVNPRYDNGRMMKMPDLMEAINKAKMQKEKI